MTSLRELILRLLPGAEEGLSYGAPVFRLDGVSVAGMSVAKAHISFLPHSGDVLSEFAADDLGGLPRSKGALKLPIDRPPPVDVIAAVIAARRREAGV